MSKAVRWQIPFKSINGTRYRIDIYDDTGSWSGITNLLAGPQPIVTDEDDNSDFFAPIRIQTGYIQVCTAIPNGGTLKMEDILPANNISRPVKLVSIDDNSNETVEWQGFLKCEAYNQNYTSIPEILSLPINSVLEAMDSVPINISSILGLKKINVHIYNILTEIEQRTGITFFTHIRYSGAAFRIFSKYIDATSFYGRKEYNNENSTTYIIDGLSCKNVLERFCTYMGWTIREQGTEVFLSRLYEELGMYRDTMYNFGNNFNPTGMAQVSVNIADLTWRGTDHQRSISQGAKSVEVIARMEDYEMNIELPESPVGSISYQETMEMIKDDGYSGFGTSITVDSWVNDNRNFINTCHFYYWATSRSSWLDPVTISGTATLDQLLSVALINPISSGTWNTLRCNPYIGAFMARLKITNEEAVSGLYIVCTRTTTNHFTPTTANYVFSIHSLLSYSLPKGKLAIRYDMIPIMYGDYGKAWFPGSTQKYLVLCLKFGDKYWNGSAWSSSFAYFKISQSMLVDEEYDIAIDSRMEGELIVWVYGICEDLCIPLDQVQEEGSDIFLRALSVEYIVEKEDGRYDRKENHYFKLLSTNFRDKISVNTDFASWLKTQLSPSLIMDGASTPMTELIYSLAPSGTESRRPEVDLLNRLATYYSAARQRLQLKVVHPTTAPLPLLQLNGIGDEKVYLPLAESRDWQMEISTITCFEK